MISHIQLLLLLVSTVGGLAAAYMLHLPLFAGFSAGFLVLLAICRQLGFRLSGLVRPMLAGAAQTREVVWILLLVGVLIPAWTASGTIPYLIDAGVSVIPPTFFLTGCFLFSAAVCLLLGTSTGTLSFAGIPLIGVSAMLHIPLAYTAGALVSGAFVGEKVSPFSSARRLVAASTGVEMQAQGRAAQPTAIAGLIAAAAGYSLLDLGGQWQVPPEYAFGGMFASHFHYGFWLALPPCLLIVSILLRLKTRTAFLLSTAAAVLIGTLTQHIDAGAWSHYIWYGYDEISQPALRGKGVFHMFELVTLILIAGAFNGILEHTRMAESYWIKVVGAGGSMGLSTLRTSLFAFGLCLVSCTQTLPIMMSGRNLLHAWKAKFPADHLSRVVSDTSLLFAAMIPWNMLALLCGTIVGVDVADYVPYAFFLWTVPLFTAVVSFAYDWKKRRIPEQASMIK